MTSIAKIESNRRNAKKSTGPTSKIGKSRACLNAVRHGLYAKIFLLPGEDAEAVAALQSAIIEEYKPEGTLENLMVRRIVSCALRLNRQELAAHVALKQVEIDADSQLRGLTNPNQVMTSADINSALRQKLSDEEFHEPTANRPASEAPGKKSPSGRSTLQQNSLPIGLTYFFAYGDGPNNRHVAAIESRIGSTVREISRLLNELIEMRERRKKSAEKATRDDLSPISRRKSQNRVPTNLNIKNCPPPVGNVDAEGRLSNLFDRLADVKIDRLGSSE